MKEKSVADSLYMAKKNTLPGMSPDGVRLNAVFVYESETCHWNVFWLGEVSGRLLATCKGREAKQAHTEDSG